MDTALDEFTAEDRIREGWPLNEIASEVLHKRMVHEELPQE